MYMMAPPSRKHQRISTRLVSIIDRYIEEHKGKCEVYAAPFAVYLDERSNTYVEPDISVIFKFQSILYAPFDENKAFYIVKSIIILSISVYDFPREGFCFICCTSLIADIVSLFGISLENY